MRPLLSFKLLKRGAFKVVNTANSKPLALQQESSVQPAQSITPEEPS